MQGGSDAFKTSLRQEKGKVEDRITEIERILELDEKFPDIDQHGRGKTMMMFSKCANVMADKVEIALECNCCPQATLIASPFVDLGYQRVYSNPCRIPIGIAVDFDKSGYEHFTDWDTRMREYGISDVAIKIVLDYLEQNPPQHPEP